MNDAEVIEAVLAGDIDRYRELVSRYQEKSWHLANSFVRNWEDAKEIAQNSFIKAYQHLGRFKAESKFSTWLYRIVVNECKDYLKKRNRQPLHLEAMGTDEEGESRSFEIADASADPRREVAQKELNQELNLAISYLPFKQKEAFILHYIHGLILEDVAKVMKCRLGTVKSHVFRARNTLRVKLEGYLVKEAVS